MDLAWFVGFVFFFLKFNERNSDFNIQSNIRYGQVS